MSEVPLYSPLGASEVDGALRGAARRQVVVRVPLLLRKVDIRLPGKGNSNSHGARPVHQIISMIK